MRSTVTISRQSFDAEVAGSNPVARLTLSNDFPADRDSLQLLGKDMPAFA